MLSLDSLTTIATLMLFMQWLAWVACWRPFGFLFTPKLKGTDTSTVLFGQLIIMIHDDYFEALLVATSKYHVDYGFSLLE